MQKKCLGQKKSSICSSDFCSSECQTQCWRFVMCQRGMWRSGLRLNWLAQCHLHCMRKLDCHPGLSDKSQTSWYVTPAYFCLYFLRTETFCVMIIPLSFPGIDTVTKFKLPSCPENVSFMCVLYTQAFISIWFWNLGATQGSPLACSHHVPLIFFTPNLVPPHPLFCPFLGSF